MLAVDHGRMRFPDEPTFPIFTAILTYYTPSALDCLYHAVFRLWATNRVPGDCIVVWTSCK